MTELRDLRDANIRRQSKWPGAGAVDLSFRGLELGGEVGEALNKLKKLIRVRRGIRGQHTEERHTQDAELRRTIALELADVVICADLVAMELDIDLDEAVPRKFDITSHKVGVNSFFERNEADGETDRLQTDEPGVPAL